jgi:hypothetical protein
MSKSPIAIIGIDLGKNSFHVFDGRGAIVLRQKRSRHQLESSLANMTPCLIGRTRPSLPQSDDVRARLSARDAGNGVRRARAGVRVLQGCHGVLLLGAIDSYENFAMLFRGRPPCMRLASAPPERPSFLPA